MKMNSFKFQLVFVVLFAIYNTSVYSNQMSILVVNKLDDPLEILCNDNGNQFYEVLAPDGGYAVWSIDAANPNPSSSCDLLTKSSEKKFPLFDAKECAESGCGWSVTKDGLYQYVNGSFLFKYSW